MKGNDNIVIRATGDTYVIINYTKYNRLKASGYDVNDAWRCSHTHVNSNDVANVIRKNVLLNRPPRTKSYRLLESHYRLSDDPDYLLEIEERMLSHRLSRK